MATELGANKLEVPPSINYIKRGNQYKALVIERSVTSRYHGSSISG